MKILGCICCFNENVGAPLDGMLAQTRPLDRVLVVDNGSTQPDAAGPIPAGVAMIRLERNLGVSSGVAAGFEWAIAHDYDWMWFFDADSGPPPDALEKLLALYETFPENERAQIGLLACSHRLLPSNEMLLGRRFTPGGPRNARVDPARGWYECDAEIWSGSLYRIEAVRKVGLPRHGVNAWYEDLGHDYSDLAYSNAVRRAGYRLIVHRGALMDQQVGNAKLIRFAGRTVLSTNHAARRRYVFFRNQTFFWLHIFPQHRWLSLLTWMMARLAVTIFKILLVEDQAGAKVRACLLGTWHGARKQLDRSWE